MTWNDPRFSSFGLTEGFQAFQREEGIDVREWDAENGEESIRLAEKADVDITLVILC